MAVTKLTDWNTPAYAAAPNGNITIPAGADRQVVITYAYGRNESLGVHNPGVTLGGEAPTHTEEHHGDDTSDNRNPHRYVWLFDEAAITAMGGDGTYAIGFTSSGLPGTARNWQWSILEDVDQTLPLPAAGSRWVFQQSGTLVEASGLTVGAGDYQYATYVHYGTQNRSFVWAGLTERFERKSTANEDNLSSTIGWGDDLQVEATTVSVTKNTSDTARTGLLVLGFKEATAGSTPSISTINGDDVVLSTPLDSEPPLPPNIIAGANLTGTTAVELGGVVQDTLVVVDDATVTFETKIVGATTDLKNGAHLVDLRNPAGDVTDFPIDLIPETGAGYIDVAGLPWTPGEISVLDGLVPAAANGDQIAFSLFTHTDNAVVMNADGTFTIAAGGTASQSFVVSVWRAADNGGRWSEPFTVFVNFTPVITRVSLDDISDVSEAPVQIDGDHFGEVQGTSKVYLNMDGQGFDGNEVEQTVAATGTPNGTGWSYTQIFIDDWTIGTLPGGTTMQALIKVE